LKYSVNLRCYFDLFMPLSTQEGGDRRARNLQHSCVPPTAHLSVWMFGACSRDVTLRTQRGRSRVRRRYAQALCVCAALPNVVVGSSIGIAQTTSRSFHSHLRARAEVVPAHEARGRCDLSHRRSGSCGGGTLLAEQANACRRHAHSFGCRSVFTVSPKNM
jgi:hypothetical protein